MVQRFPRSLRVRLECIEQVRQAVRRSDFAKNQALAEGAKLALATVQNFLSAKPVSRENFFKLCESLELDWQQIADLGISSDVPPSRLVEPPENRRDVSSPELAPNRPKTLITGYKQHSLQTQQLSQALESAGQTVSLAQDWLQQSDDDLTQYDCFLLLVPNTLTAESINEQIQRVQGLRYGRSDGSPSYALIHVGAPISLPLNHPLHRDLQGILQWDWSLEELPTFAQRLLEPGLSPKSAITLEEPQSSKGWVTLLQNLSQPNASRSWLLTYVGESQLRKLEDLVAGLEDRNDRRIQSGYAY